VGLLDFTQTLVNEHLSLAVEQLARARILETRPEKPWDWGKARRHALSSVLHAYCGFEGAVNFIGYEMFFNPRSAKYVPPETRDFSLELMVRSWDAKVGATEKFKYILSTAKAGTLAKLGNELRELNTYRNWIAHGVPYSTTVLVGPQPGGTLLELDREDNVNWKSKFPNTKFHPLDTADRTDAATALHIVLESVKVLTSHVARIYFWVCPLLKGPDYRIITADFDIDAYIDEQSGR
jgi:hypothetical protein